MRNATLASAFALALSVSVTGCSPEVPANPTYDKEVGAILNAHCVRCHSADFTPVRDPISGTDKVPRVCHFNSRDAAIANNCSVMIPLFIDPELPDISRMPKPPSDRLNDWEVDVLTRWAANPQ